MNDVLIKKGNMYGKGVFANKNFKKGEIVINYNLQRLTKKALQKLSAKEKNFTHTHHGVTYLYSVPERYINHSPHPNTIQDLHYKCDIALKDIKKGEEITTDATKDDIS